MNMWRKSPPRHLPLAEGPYVPGCFDLMTDYSPEGCFIRLHYPSSLTNVKDHSSLWIPWLESYIYLDALAFVLHVWRIVLRLLFFIFARNVHIPVLWEVPIREEGGQLPVIVFSHGLGGSRFCYSCMCNELASRGFVVAAIEHRDSSACTTFYYKSPEDKRKGICTWICFKQVPLGTRHYPVRNKQVDYRAQECHKVVDLLEKLNSGAAVENILGEKFVLSKLKGRLDLTNLVIAGHSFGGATALKALAYDSRYRVGVILDGWMFPLKEEVNLPNVIHQPILFINTETFPIPSNVSVMKTFVDNIPGKDTERAVYTIRSTTHESQTDSPHLVGYWLNWFMKKLDPVVAMRINHNLILSFLYRHIGVPAGEIDEKFLQSQAHNVVQSLSI